MQHITSFCSLDTSVEKGPGWLYTKEFRAGPNDILDEIESQFWTDLIDEYLKVLEGRFFVSYH